MAGLGAGRVAGVRVQQQLVLQQHAPRLLQLVVLPLLRALQVVHVQQHDLERGGHAPLLLHRAELLRGGGHPLQGLVQHPHLA